MSGDLKDIVWQSARIISGYDATRVRQDACGAWIAYNEFNNHESIFGWEIDHIYPVFKLKQLGVPEILWNNLLYLLLSFKMNFSISLSIFLAFLLDCFSAIFCFQAGTF
jgi:hypothetical protein